MHLVMIGCGRADSSGVGAHAPAENYGFARVDRLLGFTVFHCVAANRTSESQEAER